MKRALLIITISVITSCNKKIQNTCKIPNSLKNKITDVLNNKIDSEEGFYDINNYLFAKEAEKKYHKTDSLKNIKSCDLYAKSLESFFQSENVYKRALSYRLIGFMKDSLYNNKLIKRLSEGEKTILKQWNIIALMDNKVPNTSDLIFEQFVNDTSLPIQILGGIFVKYDDVAVKQTCWKNIDSKNKKAQILSIQFLASYGRDEKLLQKIREFTVKWEEDYQGYLLSALSMQNEGNIKELVVPYENTKNDRLRNQIISTLENSPTSEDQLYAEKLKKLNTAKPK
ncbi:conserved hypothetical protein [Tenacibaculum litopenaei]|uniref:hypothetical protein n=1 Tax=Tenacibaculum litopenaei TaxID=396016 RepID=UPI003894DFF8